MEYLVTQGTLWNGLEEIRTTKNMSEITLSVIADCSFIKLYFNRFESFTYL